MKHFLLSVCLIGSMGVASAQSFEIHDAYGTDITGGTIEFNGHNDAFNIVEGHMGVKNISSGSIDVKVKRYEISPVAGSQNYFCWYLCYASVEAGTNPEFPVPGSSASYHYRTVEADSVDDALSVYHRPEGTVGTSTYRYVVFDGNNASDSVFVDVIFNIGYVGVNEVEKLQTTHYPNPASSNLKIKLSNSSNNLTINVVDMLGKKVASLPVNGDVVNINVADYKNGVYFYSVISDKGVLLTRKFIVSK